MMTALSVDGGRSWTKTAPLAVGAEILPRLVVDAIGRLHVVYRGSSQPGLFNAPGAVMHSTWAHGVWSTPEIVSTSESLTNPTAGPAPDGGMMVTWTDAKFDPRGIDPKTAARIWTPRCK